MLQQNFRSLFTSTFFHTSRVPAILDEPLRGKIEAAERSRVYSPGRDPADDPVRPLGPLFLEKTNYRELLAAWPSPTSFEGPVTGETTGTNTAGNRNDQAF